MEWIDIFGSVKKPANKPKLPSNGSKNQKVPKATEKPAILKEDTPQKDSSENSESLESLEWIDIFGSLKNPANKPK